MTNNQIMELKLNIGYQELLELIRQLPASQIKKLRADLSLIEAGHKGVNEFQELLLKGPVMDDEQYQEFLQNRKYFNAWRTR